MCKTRWATSCSLPGKKKKINVQFFGCGMEIPCDGDDNNGDSVFNTWCFVNPNCTTARKSTEGADWDFCPYASTTTTTVTTTTLNATLWEMLNMNKQGKPTVTRIPPVISSTMDTRKRFQQRNSTTTTTPEGWEDPSKSSGGALSGTAVFRILLFPVFLDAATTFLFLGIIESCFLKVGIFHSNTVKMYRVLWRLMKVPGIMASRHRACDPRRTPSPECHLPTWRFLKPHFLFYGVASVTRCVIPYAYRKILGMLFKVMKLCSN